jgi:large subunit ribosomal protein L30
MAAKEKTKAAKGAVKLRIKLIKSLTGRKDSHIATAQSLGLRRIGHETVQPDNGATRGKIAHIGYLIQVTEEA